MIEALPVRDHRRLAAVLALVAVLPYALVLGGDFVWDDHAQLEQNARFALSDLPGYWFHAENAFAEVGRPSKYNPLGWSLFLLESVVSGGARPAWLYHASSLAVHGLGAGLFALLLLGIGRRAGWSRPELLTVVATMWFAWSPVQAEVVCWPSARFDSIAFVLLAAGGLVLLHAGSWSGRLLGGLIAASALLSKEAAIPGVLLLAPGLAWLEGPERLRAWRGWVPGAAGAVAGTGLVMLARRLVGVSLPSDLEALPISKIVAAEAGLLRVAVVQDELSLMRPIPSQIQPADLAVLMGFVAVGVVGLALFRRPAARLLAFGALWSAALALPGAVAAVRYELMPDRYAYLAVPGLALIVGAAVVEAREVLRPALARWLVPVLVCLALLFAARDLAQTDRFTDDVALFQWEREAFPEVPQTAWFLGMVLAERGQLEEAEQELLRSTELGPKLAQTWREAADLQARMGHLDRALRTVDQGLAELPGDPSLVELRRSVWAAGGR